MRISQVFDNAKLYETFQFAVAKKSTHRIIRDEIIQPAGVSEVLDFGCGIGYHSKLFTDANYLGIEPLASCIKMANASYSGSNVEFRLGDHSLLKTLKSESFDLVVAICVLHHIDDEILENFSKEAYRVLNIGGRLTTFDPVFHGEQSKISKWVVSQDRGEWVRTEQHYLDLIKKSFPGRIESCIYSKLLRIPYDHIAISAIKNSN
jgi:SAM-dependent methyltransferase